MQRIYELLHLDRYVSSRLILLLDLFVSVFSSICALLFCEFLRLERLPAEVLVMYVGSAAVSAWGFFLLFKTYSAVIRHSSLREVGRLTLAMLGKAVVTWLCVMMLSQAVSEKLACVLVLFDFLLGISLLVLLRVAMVEAYDLIRKRLKYTRERKRVFVYGTDEKAVALALRFRNSVHYHIDGFLCYGERSKKTLLSGWKVFFFRDKRDYAALTVRHEIDAVLFATAEAARDEKDRLLRILRECRCAALIAPPLDEIVDGTPWRQPIREIRIEDLLGRPEINISMDEIIANFRGKVIMVTGAAGSIGSELCRQLATFGVEKLVLFDNAETPMHNLRLELEEKFKDLHFIPVIGDVRLDRRLDFAFRKYRPQIVFHAAAYKHVPLMEENPCEAVLVNVTGTRYVADKCVEYGVEKMVMISTDKAVNPTNIMGCTKRLAEIYVQSLGLSIEHGQTVGKTKFVTTRFGNVLGSNGSVIPRFREQIAKGGPVTVTHPDITRFFMTIPEACRLVMEAATMTGGNQIFVFDMGESVKIANLAKRMIELAGLQEGKDIKIEYTGLRPGEKLYEEVLSDAESTIPTKHDRIRIAKVREYDYADAVSAADKLEELSREVNIPDMVRLMKRTVPEFKSRNSVYEKYDRAEQPSCSGRVAGLAVTPSAPCIPSSEV